MTVVPWKAGLVAALHRSRCDGPGHKLKMTAKQASFHAERLRAKGARGMVYKCDVCGWHHTASERTSEAARRGTTVQRPRQREWPWPSFSEDAEAEEAEDG